MTNASFTLIATTLSVGFYAAQASAAPSIEITLRREAHLNSSVVRLGDVADVASTDRERCEELTASVLMPAPAPGTERFLTQRELQDLLVAHGQNLGQLRFVGHKRVAILSAASSAATQASHQGISREARRRANRIKSDAVESFARPKGAASPAQQVELERAVSDYLNTKAEEEAVWKISLDLTERHWQQLAFATSPPVCSGGHEPWTGGQRFVLSFETVKGSAFLPVYAEVSRPQPVIVAIRPIERGMTITAADVELQLLESDAVPFARAELVRSTDKVIGLEASRSIQAGDVLTTDHAKAPLLVKRGEEIAVIAQGGGIRIRATARARQDGALGDLIQVESLETRDRYDARVIGPGEVTVFTAASSKVAGRHVTGRRF